MLAGFQDLTFEFGARAIVEEATWHIHPGERIGLIGYNGTGNQPFSSCWQENTCPAQEPWKEAKPPALDICTKTSSVLTPRKAFFR